MAVFTALNMSDVVDRGISNSSSEVEEFVLRFGKLVTLDTGTLLIVFSLVFAMTLDVVELVLNVLEELRVIC